MGAITGSDLRAVQLGRPGWGRRGYRPTDVDDFLARAADALDAAAAGRTPDVTADEVRAVVFRKPPIGQRGYDEDAVDDLLDQVAAALCGGPAVGIELNGRPLGA